MPLRKTPLIEGEIYHLFNRGIERHPILFTVRDYRRFLEAVEFYRFPHLPMRLSQFLVLSKERKEEFLVKLDRGSQKLVEIICFCLMPNHYHLLVRQTEENGISNFLRLVQNSYTKYFNTKRERVGPLFQGRFKAVRVETNEQLIHLSRYIHLNPYSSYIVRSMEDLRNYPWSSLPVYLGSGKCVFIRPEIVLSPFRGSKSYQEFVFNQAEYQRELEKIKHLTFDD